MRRFYWIVFLGFPFIYSCSSTAPSLFGKQTPHEQYGKKLTDAGLKQTAVGNQWFMAAEVALQTPAPIALPYKEAGYFAAEKPRAIGLKFSAKRGEKLTFQITKRSAASFTLYVDVWKSNPTPVLKTSFDTATQVTEFIVPETGDYILRMQPELLSSGEYTLSIAAGASLGFPVAGEASRIGSVWGDTRDAGVRKHEGIDIFAPKHTPAVAAESGVVTAVNENTLGGKVVWLRPQGADYVLYYAHLDEQLVQAGQQVQKGDPIGLVGNTGNARTTPSHLHFGIYTTGGAIDPAPFVRPGTKQPQEVTTKLFQKAIRSTVPLTVSINGKETALKAQTFAEPVAVTATQYRVLFPDGTFGNMAIKNTQDILQPLRKAVITDTSYLLDQPAFNALHKRLLLAATPLDVVGRFNNFMLVKTGEGDQGWVFEKVLN